MSDAVRCSVASRARCDELAGTASTVRAFLLIEHPGPWGASVPQARLPGTLAAEVAGKARAAGVRPLLVRRHQQRRWSPDGVRVLAAHPGARGAWLESGLVARWQDVLDLDLAALGRGNSLGLPRVDGPVFAVCTHGRHDPCCAEQGRPVAAALSSTWPELTWESSHLGGDRFAGNVVVLPEGLYYGRVTSADAERLARLHLAGRLDLERLRGWSWQPVPMQVAEIALRRSLGEDRRDAVDTIGGHRDGPTTVVRFEASGQRWTVVVQASPSAERARLTCHAEHLDRLPQWRTSIRRGAPPSG